MVVVFIALGLFAWRLFVGLVNSVVLIDSLFLVYVLNV